MWCTAGRWRSVVGPNSDSIGLDANPDADDEELPTRYDIGAFVCTHKLIENSNQLIDAAGGESHGHEVFRHWELADMPGREVLDLCAEAYDELHDLLVYAHAQAGHALQLAYPKTVRGANVKSVHVAPCMRDTYEHQTARLEHQRGRQMWTNEPAGLHNG